MDRPAIVGVGLALLFGFGCGAQDPAAGQAGHAVAMAWEGLVDTERAIHGAADLEPEVRDALLDRRAVAEARWREADEVVRIWQDTGTGSFGWRTFAPCLAHAVDRLLEALEAAGLEAPVTLVQARALNDATASDCRDGHAAP